MTAITYERLHDNLERLKLTKISEILGNYLERANKDNISLIEALDYLVETERIDKDETSLIKRLFIMNGRFIPRRRGRVAKRIVV